MWVFGEKNHFVHTNPTNIGIQTLLVMYAFTIWCCILCLILVEPVRSNWFFPQRIHKFCVPIAYTYMCVSVDITNSSQQNYFKFETQHQIVNIQECLDPSFSGVCRLFPPKTHKFYVLIAHSYVCFSRYRERFTANSLQTLNPTTDCKCTHY